jgi:hypothetical protein
MAEVVQGTREFTAEQFERLEQMHGASRGVSEVFDPLSPWGSASRAIGTRLDRALRAAQGERLEPLAAEDPEREAFEDDRLQEAADSLEARGANLDKDSPWKAWFYALASGFREGRPDAHTSRLLEETWGIADALYALGRELNRRNPESSVAAEIEDLAQRLDESKMGHPLTQIAKRSEDLDLAAGNGDKG